MLAAVNPYIFTGGGVVGGIILLATLSKAVPRAWTSIKVLARLPLIIDGIAKEFYPNGGGSTRDQITRIEGTITDFRKTYEDRSQAHEARMYNLEVAVSAMREELVKKADTTMVLALGSRVMTLENEVRGNKEE